MTHKQRKFLLTLRRHDGDVSATCKVTGTARSTYYRWWKLDVEFKMAAIEVKRKLADPNEPRFPDNQYTLLETLKASGGDVDKACRAAKVSRVMFYRWKRDDPAFARAVGDIRDSFVDLAESRMIKLVKKDQWPAIQFLLTKLGIDRGYGDKVDVELRNPEGSKFIIKFVDGGDGDGNNTS